MDLSGKRVGGMGMTGPQSLGGQRPWARGFHQAMQHFLSRSQSYLFTMQFMPSCNRPHPSVVTGSHRAPAFSQG